jgi:hypothetical protein
MSLEELLVQEILLPQEEEEMNTGPFTKKGGMNEPSSIVPAGRIHLSWLPLLEISNT